MDPEPPAALVFVFKEPRREPGVLAIVRVVVGVLAEVGFLHSDRGVWGFDILAFRGAAGVLTVYCFLPREI